MAQDIIAPLDAPDCGPGGTGTGGSGDTRDRRDVEELILCDRQADGSIIRFRRRTTFDGITGAVVSEGDFTLAGGVYAPTGAVGSCSPVATPCLTCRGA